jgi:hypothetical protein
VIARPELLYESVVEVEERVVLVKEGEGDGCVGDAAAAAGASEGACARECVWKVSARVLHAVLLLGDSDK